MLTPEALKKAALSTASRTAVVDGVPAVLPNHFLPPLASMRALFEEVEARLEVRAAPGSPMDDDVLAIRVALHFLAIHALFEHADPPYVMSDVGLGDMRGLKASAQWLGRYLAADAALGAGASSQLSPLKPVLCYALFPVVLAQAPGAVPAGRLSLTPHFLRTELTLHMIHTMLRWATLDQATVIGLPSGEPVAAWARAVDALAAPLAAAARESAEAEAQFQEQHGAVASTLDLLRTAKDGNVVALQGMRIARQAIERVFVRMPVGHLVHVWMALLRLQLAPFVRSTAQNMMARIVMRDGGVRELMLQVEEAPSGGAEPPAPKIKTEGESEIDRSVYPAMQQLVSVLLMKPAHVEETMYVRALCDQANDIVEEWERRRAEAPEDADPAFSKLGLGAGYLVSLLWKRFPALAPRFMKYGFANRPAA